MIVSYHADADLKDLYSHNANYLYLIGQNPLRNVLKIPRKANIQSSFFTLNKCSCRSTYSASLPPNPELAFDIQKYTLSRCWRRTDLDGLYASCASFREPLLSGRRSNKNSLPFPLLTPKNAIVV